MMSVSAFGHAAPLLPAGTGDQVMAAKSTAFTVPFAAELPHQTLGYLPGALVRLVVDRRGSYADEVEGGPLSAPPRCFLAKARTLPSAQLYVRAKTIPMPMAAKSASHGIGP